MRHYLLIFVLLLMPAMGGCPPATNEIEHGDVSFDVSPDGKSMVFSDAGGDLWMYTFGDVTLTRLTESPELELWPSFSPDGKAVVFVRENATGHGMSVQLMTLEDRVTRRITSFDESYDSQPVFAPDGLTIAFARAHLRRRYSMGGWTWDNWDVYTVALDGSDLKRRTHGDHFSIGGVAYSVDAQQILFTAHVSRPLPSQHTLFTFTLDNATMDVTQPAEAGGFYAWYTDVHVNKAGEMVFISDRNVLFQYDVVYRSLDAQETPLGVTSISRYNKNPVFTNDGRVLFLAGTAWNAGSRAIFSLWSVNTDGTGAKQLAGSGLFTDPLVWSRQQGEAEQGDDR